jgi:hypothetical protein
MEPGILANLVEGRANLQGAHRMDQTSTANLDPTTQARDADDTELKLEVKVLRTRVRTELRGGTYVKSDLCLPPITSPR